MPGYQCMHIMTIFSGCIDHDGFPPCSRLFKGTRVLGVPKHSSEGGGQADAYAPQEQLL